MNSERLFDILSFATLIFGYLHNRVVTFSFTTASKDKSTFPKNLLYIPFYTVSRINPNESVQLWLILIDFLRNNDIIVNMS